MEFRPLEITVSSAKGLKDVNFLSKMDVYVVVSISGDPRSKQRTPVDKDGHKSPKWNHSLKFTIDEAAAQQNRLMLDFELISERTLGDKIIGEVRLPIKDLLHTNNGSGPVSYSVTAPSGKPRGTLNLSYKFGDKYTVTAPPPPQPPQKEKTADEPVTAYPAESTYPYQYPAPQGGYPHPPPPPPPGGLRGYPPDGSSMGYGYPPAPAGYGYPGYQPQPGYGYPPMQQKPPKKSRAGLGLGLGAGLLGGLLVGDMISDVSEAAAYDAGFDDAGFDF